MYASILFVHNIIRWVVLLAGVYAAINAYQGWFSKRNWAKLDRIAGVVFTSTIDIQLLLGILLYFVFSPTVSASLADFGAAMRDPNLRFFALEHALYMLLAIVVVHVGSSLSKKASSNTGKFRSAALWFTLTLVFILLGMPWMRPLLPSFG